MVDERLPDLARLLTAVLEELAAAGVDPANVTLLCEPSSSRQPWLQDLPDGFEEVRLEIHDPKDRKKLSYLAATKLGRRLYLNRTAPWTPTSWWCWRAAATTRNSAAAGPWGRSSPP